MFDNCKTRTKQGDLGEARAIYEYAKLGYMVSKPLYDSAKYDLIVDDGVSLKRVQVKTSRNRTTTGVNNFAVHLQTSGGNTKQNIKRKPEVGDYDELFVLTEADECWIIPAEHAVGKTCVVVGTQKYDQYRI